MTQDWDESEFGAAGGEYLAHLLDEEFEKMLAMLLRQYYVAKSIRAEIVERMTHTFVEMDRNAILGPNGKDGIYFDLTKKQRSELLKKWRKTKKYRDFCRAFNQS